VAILVLRRPSSTPSQLWSDPATWGGTVPIAGQDVTIAPGQTVILDVVTPALGEVVIEGNLDIPYTLTGTYGLTARQIHGEAGGAFTIGDPTHPFTGVVTIEVNGIPSEPVVAHDRSFMVHDDFRTEWYGNPPTVPWTTLGASAAAAATALTLKESVSWASGSEIVIANSDYYGLNQTEIRTLAGAVSGASATVTAGLTHPHYGVLQYATTSGMSLTAGVTTGFPAGTPTVADFRAEVGNITRNIRFRGPNDSYFTGIGFGAHFMVMNRTCKTVLKGVEFRYCGQQGFLGRYPVHFHVLSYDLSTTPPTYLGLIPEGYGIVDRCVVRDSAQRGLVIHSTHGVTLSNNIIVDIAGHGYFLEDATERKNILTGNLAVRIRAPHPSRTILLSEVGDLNDEKGPSGFWITNPDNTITNNRAADCEGAGIWFSIPTFALGISQAVVMQPNILNWGTVSGNFAHSNQGSGILTRNNVSDPNTGDTSISAYIEPRVGEVPGGAVMETVFTDLTVYKNSNGAYRNRVHTPRYSRLITADNYGTDFAGATIGGNLFESLIIGQSLNNATTTRPAPLPYYAADVQRAGAASYHSSLAIHDNVIIDFAQVISNNYGSGAFKVDDLYVDAIEVGNYRNGGNVLVNCFPGYFTLPPNLLGAAYQIAGRNFTFAGAFRDFHGYWGDASKWRVYDVAFLTYGATTTNIAPSALSPFADRSIKTNGVYVDTAQFYGVQNYYTNFDPSTFAFSSHIRATRYDSGWALIDTWEVPEGNFLANMRHFAAAKNGRYGLEFPDHAPPTLFECSILNCYRSDDAFLMWVEFDANVAITIAYYAHNYNGTGTARRTLTPAANLNAVEAGAGDLYWRDTDNNRIYVLIKGGLVYPGTPTPGSDTDLQRPISLHFNR
jgi:hypothetical protein